MGRQTALRLQIHSDARSFLHRALDWLLASEAEHTLILGVALGRASGEVVDEPPAWFATLEQDGDIVGAVFRTPPHMLGVTALPPGGPEVVVDAAAARFADLPGVVGPPSAVREVAQRWSRRHPVAVRPDMEMAIHELTELRWPTELPDGHSRTATLDDLELLTVWMEGFEEDTGIFSTGAEALTRHLIDAEAVTVWEVETGPVSMAARSGATPNAVRVSYVYTPPEFRGRGYGGAVTAHLTRDILESGHEMAVLYTDLDDPVPNHIYRTLGYRKVGSATAVRFETMAGEVGGP